MSAAAPPLPAPVGIRDQHAPATVYEAFLRDERTPEATIQTRLKQRARFVLRYPDLAVWHTVPLPERIGRLWGEPANGLTCRVTYEARPYLLYLGVTGQLYHDWDWLLAVRRLDIWRLLTRLGTIDAWNGLTAAAETLGFEQRSASAYVHWGVSRLVLRTGLRDPMSLCDVYLDDFALAIERFAAHPDVAAFYGSAAHYQAESPIYQTYVRQLRTVLYHLGQSEVEPMRQTPPPAAKPSAPPALQQVIDRFLAERHLTFEAKTVDHNAEHLRRFTGWLAAQHPEIETFAAVTRDHVLAFAADLHTVVNPRTGQPLAVQTRLSILASLAVFFRQISAWGTPDVPVAPLLGPSDLPKRPHHVPRYIPDHELGPVMKAVRGLTCPYGRTALLVARWSGARRDEIRRLAFDCLDTYPDGTARLRIPAGKTYCERCVPLNEEAAVAIRALQAGRGPERGFRDRKTGLETRYLFVRRGKHLADFSLFVMPLLRVCVQAGLLTAQEKATVTAHRFRHTVGKQLAERGAKLRTIMSILGHTSATMSMVYAYISDPEVLRDYQSVLGPGATIAGPFAEQLRAGAVAGTTVDWIKTNFFKTELELGHCLRLPQEGPCECDLALTCAKFVTTRAYVPQLRRRRQCELTLIEDALSRGWPREVERHRGIVRRLEQLLAELGEAPDDASDDGAGRTTEVRL